MKEFCVVQNDIEGMVIGRLTEKESVLEIIADWRELPFFDVDEIVRVI